MKPKDKLKAWKSEAAYDRVHGCRVMLRMHGFLSEGENAKVVQRINKWVKKHGEA